MIIPIRCWTCNQPLAGKYKKYMELVLKYSNGDLTEQSKLIVINDALYKEKTPQCKALDELGVERMCCRTKFLAHVEILPNIN